MRIPTFGGATQNTIGLVLAIVALLAAAAGGAMAFPTVREEVISSIGMEQARGAWRITNSRLTVPPGAEWETSLGSGPLALTVESGRISVVLDGGLARIETTAATARGRIHQAARNRIQDRTGVWRSTRDRPRRRTARHERRRRGGRRYALARSLCASSDQVRSSVNENSIRVTTRFVMQRTTHDWPIVGQSCDRR